MAYVTSEELQTELENLANSLGITIDELLQDYVTTDSYALDKAAIEARIGAIDVIDSEDGVDTIAEKVNAINTVISNNDGEIQGILDLITANDTAITAEETRALGIESGLRTDVDVAIAKSTANETSINTLSGTVSDNKTAIEGTVNALDTRVGTAEGSLTTLNGDTTVVGSVAKQVADAKSEANTYADTKVATAETNAVASAKTYTDTEVAGVQTQLDALTGEGSGSLGEVEGRVGVVENRLDDTLAEDGVTVIKGIDSKIADGVTATTAVQTDVNAKDTATNARIDDLVGAGLTKGVICGVKATNIFRAHFGLAALDEANCPSA